MLRKLKSRETQDQDPIAVDEGEQGERRTYLCRENDKRAGAEWPVTE